MLRDVEDRPKDVRAKTAARALQAEEYAYRIGQQIQWHRHHRNWIEVVVLVRAFKEYRKQFGPWLQLRLKEAANAGMRDIWYTTSTS